MTAFALALVLASAVAHATWNLFAKRASGGAPFLWLAFALSIPLYGPIAIAVLIVSGARLGPVEALWMFVNAALNVAYGIFLLRGYRAGDLSVVYPLARGTGPVLALGGAIVLFGERPTPLALAGAIAIVLGVLALTGDPRKLRQRGVGVAVGYALLTGVTIAAPRRKTPGSERFGKNGPRTMSRAAAPHRMRAIVRSTRCASSSSPSLTRRGDYPSASAMTPPTMRTAAIDLLPISASASVRAPMSTPMRIPISRAGAT